MSTQYLSSEIIYLILNFLSFEHSTFVLCQLSLICKSYYHNCSLLDKYFWKKLILEKFSKYLLNDNQILFLKENENKIERIGYKKCYSFIKSKIFDKKLITELDEKKKFFICGSSGVGKTTTVKRFIDNVFVDWYDQCIIEEYHKKVIIDNKPCHIEIFDSACSEIPISEVLLFDGVVFMCSIHNEESLTEVINNIQFIYSLKNNVKLPFLFCINKCDLEEERIVTKEMVDRELNNLMERNPNILKKEYKVDEILLTSAKLNVNVNEIFYKLVKFCRLQEIDLFTILQQFLQKYESSTKKKCILQ
ncbi:hypothetical protein ABK040_014442 [Willaertia magna]